MGRFDQFWTQTARKVEAIDVGGYLEGKIAISETARTSITRHSLMPMILPSESSICHTNLGATRCYVSYLGMATACNNEDYAKIGTRPHLDTVY